jgi:hypothetical protein
VVAKWDSELFAMTTDSDPVCFCCYGKSIKLVGLLENATEMIAIFENKSSQLQLKLFNLGKCNSGIFVFDVINN